MAQLLTVSVSCDRFYRDAGDPPSEHGPDEAQYVTSSPPREVVTAPRARSDRRRAQRPRRSQTRIRDVGPRCVRCPDGKQCVADTDCASGLCDKTGSAPLCARCGDGQKDGAETDVDCGGPRCAACSTGAMCLVGTDCKSGSCGVSGVCP